MKKSALQKARAAYKPKLPVVLTSAVKVVEGRPTESVADQAAIKSLFPNTYGLPEIRFEKNPAPAPGKPVNVGVILERCFDNVVLEVAVDGFGATDNLHTGIMRNTSALSANSTSFLVQTRLL